MGNYINKYFFHNTETEKEETKMQSPSTEEEIVEDNFHTPVIQKTLSIDPRSVTSGINRTPIEVICGIIFESNFPDVTHHVK